MRLLVVEDDPLLADGLRAGLELSGYAVDLVADGEAARLALLDGDKYAACILDLGLPQRDGLSVLRESRARGLKVPVLILTARDTSADKVSGLDAGADDYLVKPFDLQELMARIRALTRRTLGSPETTLEHRQVELDPATRMVTRLGRLVPLSGREYAVLLDLFTHKGRIRSRAELEESVYAWGEEIESNAVEVYIHHLRRKLGADLIQTCRGLGYIVGDRPS